MFYICCDRCRRIEEVKGYAYAMEDAYSENISAYNIAGSKKHLCKSCLEGALLYFEGAELKKNNKKGSK